MSSDQMTDATNWSMPGPIRKAFCELTGGHDNEFALSSVNGKIDGVSLYCSRCGKQTKFYKLPHWPIATKEQSE